VKKKKPAPLVETEALLARKREADPMGCQKKD